MKFCTDQVLIVFATPFQVSQIDVVPEVSVVRPSSWHRAVIACDPKLVRLFSESQMILGDDDCDKNSNKIVMIMILTCNSDRQVAVI